jgi:hypothetical protein
MSTVKMPPLWKQKLQWLQEQVETGLQRIANSHEPLNLPPINLEIDFDDDLDGRHITLNGPTLQTGCYVFVHARNEGDGYRKSVHSAYQDRDGDFHIRQSISEVAQIKIYIPFSSILPESDGKLRLSLRLVKPDPNGQNHNFIGEDRIQFFWPKHKDSVWRSWRPLIGLCMHLAKSNTLTKNQITLLSMQIQNHLGIEIDSDVLVKIMLQEPSKPVSEQLQNLQRRQPEYSFERLLKLLNPIAIMQGNAAKIIRDEIEAQIRPKSNKPPPNRSKVKPKPNEIELALERLGITEIIDKSQVVSACREQLRRYHPDRYQSSPPEFQALAHDITLSLLSSRDLILSQLPKERK